MNENQKEPDYEVLSDSFQEIQYIEKCYLGAVLIDEDVLDLCRASKIGPDAFGDPFARKAIAAMLDLFEAGTSVNIATIAQKLQSMDVEDRLSAVMGLEGLVQTTMHAKSHWTLIVDAWKLRNFNDLVQKLSLVSLEAKNWQEATEKSLELIADLGDTHQVERKRSQVEVAQSVIDDQKRIIEGKPLLNSNPISTGIAKLDTKFRPFDVATGDFSIIIFGVTGTGKSSLASLIAGHNVYEGKRVLMFLGESNHESLLTSMAAQRTEVNSDSRVLPTTAAESQRKYLDCLASLRDMHENNFYVFDDDFYIEDIIARCRTTAKEMGGVDLVIIDHIHCLKTRKQYSAKEERQRFNYMSGELKPLGKSLNCPVITLAQPSRDFKTSNRPPVESDLKETGNLEDDADRIWGLWLPDKDGKGVEQTKYSACPEIQVFQLKFKRGRTGKTLLRFEMKYTKFFDPTEKEQAEKEANPQMESDF